jgi:hypothetical protein
LKYFILFNAETRRSLLQVVTGVSDKPSCQLFLFVNVGGRDTAPSVSLPRIVWLSEHAVSTVTL